MPKENVTSSEAKELIEKGLVTLVDVREPAEFASARIAEAKLIPLGRLGEALNDLDRTKPIIVYCQAGTRSEQAATLLRSRGFDNVHSITGGLSAWVAAGLPTEKTPGAPWSLERQVRFTVGVLVTIFTVLGITVHPAFLALDFAIAGGLIFSALTNTCGMALVLTKMPWNRS